MTANYPDILGHITNGNRQNIGIVQAALAVRPHSVKAGRTFDIILLLQNASDASVDVKVDLHLPERDHNNRKSRFVTKFHHLVIGLLPAEVGYAIFPAACLPDTAIGRDYTVEVELHQKPVEKPQRIRQPNGGGNFEMDDLKPEVQQQIADMANIRYATSARGIRGAKALKTSFNIMPGGMAHETDLKPTWTTLWTLADHLDDRLIVDRYRDLIKEKLIPKLRREHLFRPLLLKLKDSFHEAGYDVTDTEAIFMAKLPMLVLEFASPETTGHGALAAGNLSLTPILALTDIKTEFKSPRWFSNYLRLIDKDERVASVPEQVLPDLLFKELMKDTLERGFEMVETATGEAFGTEQEKREYATQVARSLNQEGDTPDFTTAYLPLLLAGVLAHDRVVIEGEKPDALLVNLAHVLESRKSERIDETALVFQIAEQLIDRALERFGMGRK